MKNIVFKLKEAAEQPISEVGHYASDIFRYATDELEVPDGLIIPSSTVWKYFSDCKLADIWSNEITKLNFNSIDISSLEILSKPIVEQILNSDFSEEIRIELSKGYSNLSSFSDSFVNIKLCYDTPAFDIDKVEKKLNIKSFDNVCLSIKQVLASLFQPEILFDFYTYQISPFTLELPILIQKSIQCEVSGLAYNISPIDHDPNRIQIEAIVGNPEPLLNHEIIPDNFVVDKDSLNIVDKFISKQEWMQIRTNSKQVNEPSNVKIPISKSWQTRPKLEEKYVLYLSQIIRTLSDNNPMASIQLQWGFESGKFWLFDIKDLLKIESNINQRFASLGDVTQEELLQDNISNNIEVIKPRTVEVFENTFFPDSDTTPKYESTPSTNIENFEVTNKINKKPARKGIVIKNNQIVDAGDSMLKNHNPGITPTRDTAKSILYGEREKFTHSAFNDSILATDFLTVETKKELTQIENNMQDPEISLDNISTDSFIEEIIPDVATIAEIESNDSTEEAVNNNSTVVKSMITEDIPENIDDTSLLETDIEVLSHEYVSGGVQNEVSPSIPDNDISIQNFSEITNSNLTESVVNQQIEIAKAPSNDIQIPRIKLIQITNIYSFLVPFIQARRHTIKRRIAALNKQREAYNILYNNNNSNRKRQEIEPVNENFHEQNIQKFENGNSSNKINLINHTVQKQDIFLDTLDPNSSENLGGKKSYPKTVTKIFGEVHSIAKITKENIMESDGAILMNGFSIQFEYSNDDLLNITQLYSPKNIFFKLGTHPDIKYIGSNLSSIDNDLKQIKYVKIKNLKNLHVLIPYLKTVEEFENLREYMYNYGVKQSHTLKLFLGLDNIFIMHNIERLIESGVDGLVFDLEEILRISLGLTKDKYLEQKETILHEYKISESGIADMIETVSGLCKKRKVPFILNLTNINESNLDELSEIVVNNHSYGIQIDFSKVEKVRTFIKYFEEKQIINRK